MIDDLNKLIFVENPKTATHSIKRAMTRDNILHAPGVRIATINHNIPEIIQSQYPEEWRNYTTFVVVRNTWDRAHSFFDFYRRIADSKSYQAMDFDAWVAADCPAPDEDHLRAPMWGEGRMDDVLCQLRYCQGVDEIIVLHSFDHSERCREMNEGIARVSARAGVSIPPVPTDGNHYGRTDRPIPWKRSTIDRLRDRYDEEIRRFGFQPPSVA